MAKKKRGDEIAELKAMLRGAGLRSTSARLAVLQQLLATKTPLSHAELAKELVPTGLDRATVYRNLMDLAEAGIVSRAELGDHVWRYEVRREGHEHSAEHPHFVCVDCGEVTCLTETSVDITPTPGTKKSSIGSLTEVLLKGHCGKCS
ncbi:MAG: transcriptional repressor [Planctomycetaceae bacterium]|nr:transcriptional repressor [Planctomycetaceae bacterium]